MEDFFAEEENEFDNYYGEEENDYYGEQENENDFQMEIGAFERTGPSGKLADLLSGVNYNEMQKKLSQESISPEDRFLIYTDAICRRLERDNIVSMSEKDINNILEKTQLIENLKYKNPIAYIMGYLASNGGVKLNHDRVMFIINKILPKLDGEGGVEPPDVIRYARFWVQNL